MTDQRTYRSEEPTDRPEARPLTSDDFPEIMSARSDGDSGCGKNIQRREAAGSRFVLAQVEVANFCKDNPPQTILGAEQKAWFLERLEKFEGDVEDLGKYNGYAGYAGRSAEPARRG